MGLFNRKQKNDVIEKEIETALQQAKTLDLQINAQVYAFSVVTEFLAREFSKCKFNCYQNNEVTYGKDYYRFNVRPNAYQTATEFKKEIISKLLRDNECLIVEASSYDLIIADSFNKNRLGINKNTFTSVNSNNEFFAKRFIAPDDAIYISYCNDEFQINSKVNTLNNGLQKLLQQTAKKCERLNYEKGILKINAMASGNKDFKERLQKLLNNDFRAFFQSSSNAVLPLYEGFEYGKIDGNEKNEKSLSDIQTLINSMISKTAAAYGVHPAVILGDRENTEEAEKYTVAKAIKPIAEMIENALTESLYGVDGFCKGNYVKIDLTPLRFNSIFDFADASDKLLASGQYSIDDLREARGDRRLNTEWSKRHWMTKNYQNIEEMQKPESEGGEINGNA